MKKYLLVKNKWPLQSYRELGGKFSCENGFEYEKNNIPSLDLFVTDTF